MSRYQAILLDLFETVVIFDLKRLPQVHVGKTTFPSTTPLLLPLVQAHLPNATVESLTEALKVGRTLGKKERTHPHAEISSPFRFLLTLQALGIDKDAIPSLAEVLARTHTRLVCGAAVLPEQNREALSLLSENHKLALVSNFDYAPSCWGLLEREGILPLFQTVVISDDIGLRKPHPDIFNQALAALSVPANEALFVGDSVDADLTGAHALGMDVAWINKKKRPLPDKAPTPSFDIKSLAALPPLL